MDAVAIGSRVGTGELTAAAVMEAAIDRISNQNPLLNAVVIQQFDRGLDEAKKIDRQPITERPSPFAGLPMLLKDLNAPAIGLTLTQGCLFRKNYSPNFDSEVVARLRSSGSVIFGRTNTPQYGAASVTDSRLWGPARNPWDHAYTPGGSSGGAAAAVAAGMVPIAHGNDAGGSDRTPASFCGLVGLKASRGRIPYGPELPELWRGMVGDGCLSRTVRDAATYLDVISGPDLGALHYAPEPRRPFARDAEIDPLPLRIAFSVSPPLSVPLDDHIKSTVLSAAAAAASLGHHVEEASPDFESATLFCDYQLFGAAAAAFTLDMDAQRVGRAPRYDEYEPSIWLAAMLGRTISAAEYDMANVRLRAEARKIAKFFTRYDVWLTPVTTTMPSRVAGHSPAGWTERLRLEANRFRNLKRRERLEEIALTRYRTTAFLPIANVTGQPAVAIPFEVRGRLPIGVQLMGRFADEATLIQLAGQFERSFPWRGNVSWHRSAE